MAEQTNVNQKSGQFKRIEDFAEEYANNFQFEQSAFDLKLTFGQLDQSQGNVVVQQHTAITIPWVSAKLLAYFIQLNVASYELERGKITIPTELIPPSVEPPPAKDIETNPKLKQLYELYDSLRKQFVAGL